MKKEVKRMARTKEKFAITLTFLMYPSEANQNRVVAHCLELDIVAVEDSLPKVIILLKELVKEVIDKAEKDDALDKIFKPAPPMYWQMLAHAVRYEPTKKVKKHHIDVPAIPIESVGYAHSNRGVVAVP